MNKDIFSSVLYIIYMSLNLDLNFKKYLKYKNKYLNLKLKYNLHGGDNFHQELTTFIKTHYKNSSMMMGKFKGEFTEKKNATLYGNMHNNFKSSNEVVEENLDDFFDFCILNINLLVKFLYSKLSEESKKKSDITIFSYATGQATVEAVFGLYLKEIYNKSVNLIYVDIVDTTNIISSYNIFTSIIRIYYDENEHNDLRMQLDSLSYIVKEEIKKKYNFDIFITNNPQSFNFQKIVIGFDTYEDYSAVTNNNRYPLRMYNEMKNINNNLQLILDLINVTTSSSEQKLIPMIWLLWEEELDLNDIEASTIVIINTDKIDLNPRWKIDSKYAISTIDNINNIFNDISFEEAMKIKTFKDNLRKIKNELEYEEAYTPITI